MAELTPEQDAKIREYAEAFRQEFELSQKARSPLDRENQRQDIQEQLDDVVPDAIAALKWVIRHSQSESLKLKASQWLLNLKLEKEAISNDPLQKFIEEMASSGASGSTTSE